jgi:hypothetical protein
MIRKTLIGSLLVASLVCTVHAGGFGSSFAGGFAGGVAAGIVNRAIDAASGGRPKTVVVEKKVVVHEREHHAKSDSEGTQLSDADIQKQGYEQGKNYPVASGVQLSASEVRDTAEVQAFHNGYKTEGHQRKAFVEGWVDGYSDGHKTETAPASLPTPSTMPTPVPVQTELVPVVNREVHATTDPIKIDNPVGLIDAEKALLNDKKAVAAYFDDFFHRTKPQFSLSDSSLFMEVQIGAYYYLVAKITMNTPENGTLEQGFVVDLKTGYRAVVGLDTYHEFMHTGNTNLLGEKNLNPLD